MKPRSSNVRTILLLGPAIAGLAAFAAVTRGPADDCTSITPSGSCTLGGFDVYFSSDAAGSITSDTVSLTAGAVYLDDQSNAQAVTSAYVKTSYATAGGPSPVKIEDPTTAAATNASFIVIQGDTTSTVALVQGTLSQPSNLTTPGCQMTYPPKGGKKGQFQSDSLVSWFEQQFDLNINVPNAHC